PARRYRQILDEIITTIQRFGDTSKVEYFCRYWLTAVQSHVDHHGDEYFEEAKDFRHALDRIQAGLALADPRKIAEARDNTVEQLAAMAKIIKGGRPKGSGKKSTPERTVDQPSLF